MKRLGDDKESKLSHFVSLPAFFPLLKKAWGLRNGYQDEINMPIKS